VDEHRLERRAQITQLLLDAARALGETLEPDRIYDRFHELLADVIPHDGVVVSSYDAESELIHCQYAWSDGNRLDASIFPSLPLNREGGGMQSRVILEGESRIINDVVEQVQEPGGTYYDVDTEGKLRKVPDSGPPATHAAMMVPVKDEGGVVGVVQVMSDSAEYTVEHLEVVEGLVAQMAAAVRNARLQAERRRLEAAEAAARAAAAEREQAANVLEAVGDGVFLLDEEGVVRLWNAAAEAITGVRPGEALGQQPARIFPQWTVLSTRIPIAKDGAAARSATLPVSFLERDVWLSFVAVDSARGIVYAFRDVTREHRLEEEKSDFVATISHELRTPMAAVYGAAETLRGREAELTEEQKRTLVEMIATQAERLSEITEEVLLATHLDRGTLRIDEEPVDVAELARSTIATIRGNLPPSIELELEIAADAGIASGSSDRIQQVLMNLVDNAVKYGAGPIRVRVEPHDGTVRIFVADSGPGIPAAEQERIFEKFYRSGPPLTRATGGTGLGLFISRELIRRMGGSLKVDSEPGEGATFVVELPRA
jgi:PAS domain S-box-containing protein